MREGSPAAVTPLSRFATAFATGVDRLCNGFSMETDVVVIGVGGVGAAVMDALSARGVHAIGVEQFTIPHDKGSSYGGTRVIRTAYFEHPHYVPLLQRAWTLWTELDEEARNVGGGLVPARGLVEKIGVINIASPEHPAMHTLLKGVKQYNLPHEILDADQIAKRTPLRPSRGYVGLFEEQGGFLRVERCTEMFVRRARSRGAQVLENETVTEVNGATVTLASGTVIKARRIVVCAGAWTAERDATRKLVEGIPLNVARQPQLWFKPVSDVSGMPAFIHFVEGAAFYGIPPVDGRGMKVCRHHAGQIVNPDTVDRVVHDDDVASVREFIRDHLPAADGELAEARICMYTNTPDEHFVVGKHGDAFIVSACSGHGYKMTIVIAEAIAELMTDGKTRHDLSLFDPQRFA
jgi:sarcosine oxidase